MKIPDRLAEIIAHKKREVESLKEKEATLKKLALKRENFRSFRRHLFFPGEITLIAEVKKASPSAGDIALNTDVVQQAMTYEAAGAHAVSVLTDEKFFKGSLADLENVRDAVKLPVLRKDFIVTPAQIYEASVAGADAILLIVAALDDHDLNDFYNRARDIQLDVLVEVHDLREMDRALDTGADIIGINNRNLHTFEVNLQSTAELAQEIPNDCLAVSESGIRTRDDVLFCRAEGINTILVGETLMKSANSAEKIRELLGITK
ncbi:MAG: indole-3-glycerol phosphate synthase TrpC [Verrucomicrobiota bacterium]